MKSREALNVEKTFDKQKIIYSAFRVPKKTEYRHYKQMVWWISIHAFVIFPL